VLSIVIPAYAEARYLASTLAALHAFLDERGWMAEVIVVTADSPDDTAAIARRELARFANARQIQPGPKIGKGRDVRAGMLAATGDSVLFMDADLATPLHHIDAALAALAAGDDIVIGRRDLARMHRDPMKTLTSRLANAAVQALLLPDVHDTQCGFKLFRGAIVRELFEPLRTTGWGFDLEVLARAKGYRIGELSIPDWCDPKGEHGLAGEIQWWARLRALGELLAITVRLGRQRLYLHSVGTVAAADAIRRSS